MMVHPITTKIPPISRPHSLLEIANKIIFQNISMIEMMKFIGRMIVAIKILIRIIK